MVAGVVVCGIVVVVVVVGGSVVVGIVVVVVGGSVVGVVPKIAPRDDRAFETDMRPQPEA